MKIELFYDKECPFCSKYSQFISLKEDHELFLLNARNYLDELEDLKVRGFDIDEGFIIRINDKEIYQGVDAIVFINKLSNNKIYFAEKDFFKFYIYPFIKKIRKILLFILRKNINLLEQKNKL